jgi:signal transduction histidine kinase
LLIGFAIADFIATARQKDQELQSAGLKSELAQFVLAIREDDYFSLLENPAKLSRESRTSSVLTWTRSFFTYFLQKGNARTFNVKTLRWEPPRSCVVEYSKDEIEARPGTKVFKLQACFAAVSNDLTGRYVYFSLRYPDNQIVRHQRGADVLASDRVTLTLKGDRLVRFDLVFEPPYLAEVRNPNHRTRFSGIHEVTAYLAGVPQQPLRAINAQAYEREIEVESGVRQNYVTILGRIDSSLFLSPSELSGAWPPEGLSKTQIGIAIFNTDSDSSESMLRMNVSQSTKGNALRSLERLYISQILSKSYLELFALAADGERENAPLWKSSDLVPLETHKRSAVQWVSDWWANAILAIGSQERSNVTILQKIDGRPSIEARLRAEAILLPDIATRYLFWLTLALVLLGVMLVVWVRALTRLQTIVRNAFEMTISSRFKGHLDDFVSRKDEIGALARTFAVLLKRTRSRSAMITRRTKEEAQARSEEMRLAQENVKARESILAAIGHEIKSPLQSLLIKIPECSEERSFVARMQRAVSALSEATSIEAAFENGTYSIKRDDIAWFLFRLAKNYSEQMQKVAYSGPKSKVYALFDAIALDTVCGHVLDNAIQRRAPNSEIQIALQQSEIGVNIEIFNYGEHISVDDLEKIFDLGYSTRGQSTNQGLGLFVSRIFVVLGMKGKIRAENRPGGVAIVIALPAG